MHKKWPIYLGPNFGGNDIIYDYQLVIKYTEIRGLSCPRRNNETISGHDKKVKILLLPKSLNIRWLRKVAFYADNKIIIIHMMYGSYLV